MLLTIGGVGVTALGIAIVIGVVLFLLFLLKLSFRGLPVRSAVTVKPEPIQPADRAEDYV